MPKWPSCRAAWGSQQRGDVSISAKPVFFYFLAAGVAIFPGKGGNLLMEA